MRLLTVYRRPGPWRRAFRGAGTLALAALLALGGLWLGRAQVARAGTADPGTDADPLVTKSYVDQFTGVVVVQLKAGQTLIAEAGTELILRSGAAIAVESGGNGLADVSAGRDLTRGVAVPLNHLLIASRSDGRGIAATADSFVLVRGKHSVR